jgi:hypothetical protein
MRPARLPASLFGPVVLAVLVALVAQPAGATVFQARSGTIKAVVVKSWNACSADGLIWPDLNAYWSQYGSIPISIDYANPDLCTGTITHDALVASGADVIILSDPSGGNQLYSQPEIDALQRYAAEGHNVIGTFLTFFCGTCGSTDNRGLGPLFGIKKTNLYFEQNVTPTYDLRWPNSPLFRNLRDPYEGKGFPVSEVPIDGVWSSNEIQFGQVTARTPDGLAVVLVRTTRSYSSIYISHMPEFGGQTQDQQFFYNAIIYPQTG